MGGGKEDIAGLVSIKGVKKMISVCTTCKKRKDCASNKKNVLACSDYIKDSIKKHKDAGSDIKSHQSNND